MGEITTIADGKKLLREQWEKGVDCPCCNQLVKLYKRKLSSSQALALIKLAQLYDADMDYHHVTEFGASRTGGEFAQLIRWGLIIDQPNDETHKRTSGMWRPTGKGMDFISNRITVPMYCNTYNGNTHGFSEEHTTILQALGNKFDYAELMAWQVFDPCSGRQAELSL